jgi:predicted dienelactone hydrolase
MADQDHRAGSALAGHLDLTRVAALGHSLGGEDSEELAASDPRVKTFIGLAGASAGALAGSGASVPDKPGLLMVGSRDRVVPPRSIIGAYALLAPPKRLVVLQGAGHLIFSDICRLVPGQGGLVAVAAKVHIALPGFLKLLATDGCQPGDLPPAEGWPVIRQAVTAQLRQVFGFDHRPAGIADLGAGFPGAVRADLAAG